MHSAHTDPGTIPGTPREIRLSPVRFENYDVVVILGPGDEFLGIAQIAMRRSFLSQEQQIDSLGDYDVSDLYRE